jgi:phage shock protein C
MEQKKLYRSDTNRVFGGVIGGIGEYFNVDPVLLRVSYILLAVFTGFIPALIAYFLFLFIVPRKPSALP